MCILAGPPSYSCKSCIESGLGTYSLTRSEREESFTQNPHIYAGKGEPLLGLHVVQPVGGLGPLHEPPGLPFMLLLLPLPVLHFDLPVADKLGGLAAHKEVLLLLCAIAIKEMEIIRGPGMILCNCHQVPTRGERRGVRKG